MGPPNSKNAFEREGMQRAGCMLQHCSGRVEIGHCTIHGGWPSFPEQRLAIMESGLGGVLGVIAYCIGLALFTEVVQWLIIYRTSAFKTLKANLEKHKKKVEEAKSAAASKNLKKKQARLENWQEEAGKMVAPMNWKMTFVTMATLFLGYKLLNKWFGGVVVARLPFEPPAFIQKISHKGLEESSDPRDCGAFFIYALCQSSVRPMVTKILDWGPSRLMLEIKPYIPKKLQADLFKDK